MRRRDCWLAGHLATLLVLGWVLLLLPVSARACPGCKEALFDPGQLPQKLATARAYAWSIGLMLAVPLGLVGGVTTLVVRAQRRKRSLDSPPQFFGGSLGIPPHGHVRGAPQERLDVTEAAGPSVGN